MPARKYRPDQYLYEESSPKEKKVSYQAYRFPSPNKELLKEFLFFVNIVVFCILTVLSAYFYLSIGTPTFLAYLFAIATGFVGLRFVQSRLKKKRRKQEKQ